MIKNKFYKKKNYFFFKSPLLLYKFLKFTVKHRLYLQTQFWQEEQLFISRFKVFSNELQLFFQRHLFMINFGSDSNLLIM